MCKIAAQCTDEVGSGGVPTVRGDPVIPGTDFEHKGDSQHERPIQAYERPGRISRFSTRKPNPAQARERIMRPR